MKINLVIRKSSDQKLKFCAVFIHFIGLKQFTFSY